jgi:predicted small lipoprotein YifL
MKKTMFVLAALALPLAACGGNGDGKLAKQVEKAADNRADAMEAEAKNLEDAAKSERKTADERADAIRAADVNAQAMTPEQRSAVVSNEAAAVR